MSSFTWVARGRQVVGLSEDPAAGVPIILSWGADASLAASTLPWAEPAYPTLLIMGIGVDLVTNATAATRRLSLTLIQPNNGQIQWQSSGTQAANLTRRWEVAPGFSLETTLANTVFREPLPHGFMMLPGLVGGAESQLTITALALQSGDNFGPVTVRGILLPS